MIHNVPTAADLETISLRLFFNAWSSVTTIVTEFNEIVGLPGEEEAEWATYAESAQTDLQGIYTLALQSQEIGIKSRIAGVSPFLLLKRHDAKPIAPGTLDYDFSDFPTIDAGDLVRAHNTFCPTPLPQEFAEDFDRLRRARNKIAHLGVFNERLDPHQLMALLFTHYSALYPDRQWLPDRLVFASTGRWSEFDGGGDWSPIGAVLTELWQISSDLTVPQTAIVFGSSADQDRFACPACAHILEKHTWGSEPYGSDIPTAFQSGDSQGTCALCQETFPLIEADCSEDDCEGKVVAVADGYDGRCVACGVIQD